MPFWFSSRHWPEIKHSHIVNIASINFLPITKKWAKRAFSDTLLDIPDMVMELVEAIRTPIQIVKIIFEPWIELKINNLDKLETIEQLDEAIVKSANKKALDLFDLLEVMDTWGEFRENIDTTEKDSDRWLVELVHVIKKIGKGHRYSPIPAVFQARDGKIYQTATHGR